MTVIGAWINIILYTHCIHIDVFMIFNFDFIFCVRYTLCFNSVLYTMLYLRAARGEQVIKFRWFILRIRRRQREREIVGCKRTVYWKSFQSLGIAKIENAAPWHFSLKVHTTRFTHFPTVYYVQHLGQIKANY